MLMYFNQTTICIIFLNCIIMYETKTSVEAYYGNDVIIYVFGGCCVFGVVFVIVINKVGLIFLKQYKSKRTFHHSVTRNTSQKHTKKRLALHNLIWWRRNLCALESYGIPQQYVPMV